MVPSVDPIQKLPKKFNFWRGIYNKDKNYILGRTPKNWGELLIFYSIFYIILAALFAICMQGLMWSLDKTVPKWTLNQSRIGDSPGLGFRPINISQGSMIWLNSKDDASIKSYVDMIDQFLIPYINPPKNSVFCDFENMPDAGKICRVDLKNFGKCTASNSYGFNSKEPCIFLKLNRIFDWIPSLYQQKNSTDLNLPEIMPQDLKQYINSLPEKKRNQVFVSCEGQNVGDKESIGKIHISPRGFPQYFYPYQMQNGYLSPLIAVQFESPKRNTNINIECIAWANNIVYRGGEKDRQGSIHFELLID